MEDEDECSCGLLQMLQPLLEGLPGCDCERDRLRPHVCPYQEEIDGDVDSLCTCCEKCERECAWDV